MKDKQFEQERLEKVKVRLKEQIDVIESKLKNQKKEIIDIRREAYENEPGMIRSFDDVVTLGSVDNAIKRAENNYFALSKEAETLRKLYNSSYFARIDFAEKNVGTEKIYIGISSFYDKKTFEFFVYDWRSPIASMFYEFDAGEAWYECADGKIHGELMLKRQFRIFNGELEYMYDSDAAVNDEILGRMLSSNVEAKLKVIINSIQREQNAVIRSSGNKNLLVFGAAGSGKTSVGLHRLAYLLFQQNQAISAKNIMVISNSYVFNAYIAQILPELGEADVPRAVFNDVINGFVPNHFRKYDFYEQAEFFLQNPNKTTRRAAVQLKYSGGFLSYMENFFREFIFKPGDITFGGEVVCSGVEMERDLNLINKQLPFKNKAARMLVYAESKINDYFEINKAAIKSQIKNKRIELWKSTDIETQMPQFNDVWEQTRAQARSKLMKTCGIDAVKMYKKILLGYVIETEGNDALYRFTAENMNAGHLFFEDWMALLCVKVYMGEIPSANHIKHVLIDEAQDYSILQHFILKNMFGKAKFTLVGDLNQGILPVLGVGGEEVLARLYGGNETVTMRLTKSYRSTKQINGLANQFIKGSETEYFDRDGSAPELVVADDLEKATAEFINCRLPHDVNLTCVITKTAAQAAALHEKLKQRFNITLIDNTDETLEKGLCIIPAPLCKGLEFDAVIIIDCELHGDDNLYYLLCTRALHHLFIITHKAKAEFWNEKITNCDGSRANLALKAETYNPVP